VKLTGRARALGSLGPKIKQLYLFMFKETGAMTVPPSCTIDCRSVIHKHIFFIKNVPVWVDQPRVEDHEDLVSQVHG
jgi:hypothetical protein